MAMIFSSIDKKAADIVKTMNQIFNQAEVGARPDAELIAAGQKAISSIPNAITAVSEELASQQMKALMSKKPESDAPKTTPGKR